MPGNVVLRKNGKQLPDQRLFSFVFGMTGMGNGFLSVWSLRRREIDAGQICRVDCSGGEMGRDEQKTAKMVPVRMAQGNKIQRHWMVVGKQRRNDVAPAVEAVGKKAASVHKSALASVLYGHSSRMA